jgi:hypothetical protein
MARHFALILALGLAGAARPDDTVTCKDGTTAKAGKGACSGHGGVDKKATPQPAEAKEARDAKASKPKKDADGGDAPLVACKDGTTSRGGKGACSGHGGVDKKAKEPPQAKSPAPAASAAPPPPPKAATAEKATAPAAKTSAESASKGKPSNTDPTGAIARCKDGTYSHSKGHEGACSRHGGVADWLDKK